MGEDTKEKDMKNPDITTQVDRLDKLAGLLAEMLEEMTPLPNKRFWDLDKKFDEEMMLQDLEDMVNKENNKK